jgi:hypothetical protein
VSTRAGQKKMHNKPVICITRLLTVGVSPFRRPPVVIHAATIDWHRIGFLLAATIRNIHNGQLICIRISSLRITSRFDCFELRKMRLHTCLHLHSFRPRKCLKIEIFNFFVEMKFHQFQLPASSAGFVTQIFDSSSLRPRKNQTFDFSIKSVHFDFFFLKII